MMVKRCLAGARAGVELHSALALGAGSARRRRGATRGGQVSGLAGGCGAGARPRAGTPIRWRPPAALRLHRAVGAMPGRTPPRSKSTRRTGRQGERARLRRIRPSAGCACSSAPLRRVATSATRRPPCAGWMPRTAPPGCRHLAAAQKEEDADGSRSHPRGHGAWRAASICTGIAPWCCCSMR